MKTGSIYKNICKPKAYIKSLELCECFVQNGLCAEIYV